MTLQSVVAGVCHLDAAWSIISTQQTLMRAAGRRQWHNGYPNREVLAADIKNGAGRVLVLDGEIVGYCAFITTGEPAYDTIDGTWLTQCTSTDCCYAVVHRMGIAPEHCGKGLAKQWLALLLNEAREKGMESLRVDTNFDNVQMLSLLPSDGFQRCGTIPWSDGGYRIGFEKLTKHPLS